ncbi:hypothetical protein PROFUN_09834 [Planoprotostelium fungivorum]|uniref:Uncharacterized protein n=1 Tax=Planoprotostelium fungivorum TaxID=1890364 RepID=A0A2P6NFK9_9EUKA|nr:hypothetical protein PROFUN_09834 [Planoprotostelium fungivorum]
MGSRAVSHHSISIAHDCLPYEFGMGSWAFSLSSTAVRSSSESINSCVFDFLVAKSENVMRVTVTSSSSTIASVLLMSNSSSTVIDVRILGDTNGQLHSLGVKQRSYSLMNALQPPSYGKPRENTEEGEEEEEQETAGKKRAPTKPKTSKNLDERETKRRVVEINDHPFYLCIINTAPKLYRNNSAINIFKVFRFETSDVSSGVAISYYIAAVIPTHDCEAYRESKRIIESKSTPLEDPSFPSFIFDCESASGPPT